MNIANSGTFKKFDEVYENIFQRKMKKGEDGIKMVSRTPIKNRFYWKQLSLLGVVAFGSIYGCWHFLDRITNLAVEHCFINHQQKMAIETILSDSRARLEAMRSNHKNPYNHNFSNHYYLTKMESDHFALNLHYNEKKIQISTQSTFSFWIFSLGNSLTTKLLTHKCDLIERKENCKVMIGSLKILGSREEKLIRREPTFKKYQQLVQTIQPGRFESSAITDGFINHCQQINYLNKQNLDHLEYEKIMKECQQNSKRIGVLIEKAVVGRLKEEMKYQRK